MSDTQFELLAKKLIDIYAYIELDIIKNISSRFSLSEDVKPTTTWLIKKLSETGTLNSENIKIIAKYSKMATKEIRNILNTVGFDSLPSLTSAYKSGIIQFDLKTFMNSQVLKNIIDLSYYNTTSTFLDINKRILESANKSYTEILTTAYLETSTGVYGYQTSIRKALNNFADVGITGATYSQSDGSVRRYDIAGVVRRDILTATHSLAVNANMALINELQPEYVKLSEHDRCRPQHFSWQGTIIKREDLVETTQLGQVDGLGGINCKHQVYAWYGKERGNELKKIDKDKNEKVYDLSQEQRYFERQIRKYKRKEAIYEDKQDKTSLELKKKASIKKREWQKKLAEFADDNGLIRQYIREKI